MDRGFFISLQAVRRQLVAMPNELYLLRLIHRQTRKPFPAEPLWTGFQLSRGSMVRFLRLRNSDGFDIYIRPHAEQQNTGYILLDLDLAATSIVHTMRANGHQPCVVTQTSAGHLQAWVRVSQAPLEPLVATAIGQQLAHLYGGDPASTDWCHLGRLAGFTNQKPARCQANGYAPWVRLLYAQAQLATNWLSLIEGAQRQLSPSLTPGCQTVDPGPSAPASSPSPVATLSPTAAAAIYQRFLNRLRIPQRFPQPDWSIVDLWIAKELLRCRTSAEQVQAILQFGSPGFPRRHVRPEDYLARTLRRAAQDLHPTPFSARSFAPCVPSYDQR